MSYVSQQYLNCDASTLTSFKAWGQAISNAFSLSGWVQTADTGQVNWSTVTLPALGATVYEIWKPADALQTGSTQYFVKVQYGRSGSGGAIVQFTLGFSTDGAGNLVGNTAGGFTVGSFANNTGVFECNFSGDIDRMSIMMWRGGSSQVHFTMGIERTHNTDGTASSDGVATFYNGSSQMLHFATTQSPNGNQGSMTIPFANADMAFNNNVPVSPAFMTYGKISNPFTVIAWVPKNDIASGGLFTTTLYGSTRTYMVDQAVTTGNSAIAMRYD